MIDLIIKDNLLFIFHSVLGRLNEFEQMVYLGLGPGLAKVPADLFGKIAVKVRNDVERLPPAVDDLEAWLPVFFTGSAVFEENRPAQPGTAPLSCIVLVIHFPAVFYLLRPLTADCQLPTADCRLPTVIVSTGSL